MSFSLKNKDNGNSKLEAKLRISGASNKFTDSQKLKLTDNSRTSSDISDDYKKTSKREPSSFPPVAEKSPEHSAPVSSERQQSSNSPRNGKDYETFGKPSPQTDNDNALNLSNNSINTSHTSTNTKTRNLLLEDLRQHDETVKCREHVSEKVQYYCFSCEMTICVECLLDNSHANHDVLNIKKSREKIQQKAEEMFMEIRNKIDILSMNEKKLGYKRNEYVDTVNQSKKLITSNFDELRKVLDKKEQELIKSANASIKEKFWEIDNCISLLRDRSEFLTQLYNILEGQMQSLSEVNFCDYFARKANKISNYVLDDDSARIEEVARIDKARCVLNNDTLKSFIDGLNHVRIEVLNQRMFDNISRGNSLSQRSDNTVSENERIKDINKKYKELTESISPRNQQISEDNLQQTLSQKQMRKDLSSPPSNPMKIVDGLKLEPPTSISTPSSFLGLTPTSIAFSGTPSKFSVQSPVIDRLLRNSTQTSPAGREKLSMASYLEGKYKDILDLAPRTSISASNPIKDRINALSQTLKQASSPTVFKKKPDSQVVLDYAYASRPSSAADKILTDHNTRILRTPSNNSIMKAASTLTRSKDSKESLLQNSVERSRGSLKSMSNFSSTLSNRGLNSASKVNVLSSPKQERGNSIISLLGRQRSDFLNRQGVRSSFA